jgi:hypothetical protein
MPGLATGDVWKKLAHQSGCSDFFNGTHRPRKNLSEGALYSKAGTILKSEGSNFASSPTRPNDGWQLHDV